MDNLLTMEEKNKLFSKDNKTFCVFPFLHLYVSSSGDVLLCCVFSNHNEFQEKLGNINDNSIEEILNGEQYKEIRRKMINGKLIKIRKENFFSTFFPELNEIFSEYEKF